MTTLLEDVQSAAEWISQALQSSGYNADFTPDSLGEVERFFTEQIKDGEPLKEGLLSEDIGKRLFAIGSYSGEVLRKELGGEWHTDDSDTHAEINIALKLEDGTVCWPVQIMMKRAKSSDENIVAWAKGLGSNTRAEVFPK